MKLDMFSVTELTLDTIGLLPIEFYGFSLGNTVARLRNLQVVCRSL